VSSGFLGVLCVRVFGLGDTNGKILTTEGTEKCREKAGYG
jgi:hypothetical protein